MSDWGAFEIGRVVSSPAASSSRSVRTAAAPINLQTLSVSQGTSLLSAEAVREQMHAASRSMLTAFGAFTSSTKPVFTTNIVTRPDVVARADGAAARLAAVPASLSMLWATAEVNAQASAARSSSAAIGLDLTAAHSRLESAALALDVVDASSLIASTAEMNGAAKSLSTSSLTLENSTSQIEISGAYTGNATSLTFDITIGSPVTVGAVPTVVSFDVLDQNGSVVASYSGLTSAGQVIDLSSIGVKVRFTEGSLKSSGVGTVDVSATPTDVSTSAAFDAAWGTAPQFENFGKVTAGSFSVNGVSIAVNATDSIDAVLARINGSAAGVTASVAGDRIVLASTSASESPITLAGDTSGFLAATKLAGATTSIGNLRDDHQAFADVAAFASIVDGTFQVNGATIAIDAGQDSLASVIQKINDAGAGVTATFDAATKRIVLETDDDSQDLIVVGGDSTGLLAAAGLSTANTAIGSIADDVQALTGTAAFAGVVAGSFEVNGVSIAIDPAVDSLQDVIARVNASAAGVTASYDSVTDRLTFAPNVAGEAVLLANDTTGLLAAARVAEGWTGTRLDPDAAFDGSDGRDPLFDPGVSVQAGSFTINGVAIAVSADDSVNSVLARVTASAAGVTATYDSATELVTLTSKVAGADPIVLGADTSGFLAAVKLDGTAQHSTGNVAVNAFDSVLSLMPEYAGVSSGTLTINGQAIAIDPSATTIESLIAAIDGLATVEATVDESTGALWLWSTDSTLSIDLADTSGILDVLGIAEGAYHGTPGGTTISETQTGTTVISNSRDVAEAVARAARELGGVLTEIARAREGDDELLAEVVASATDAVQALRDAGLAGLTIGGEGSDLRVVVDEEALVAALDAFGDPKRVATVVSGALDEMTARIAVAAETPQPAETPAADARALSLARAKLVSDQAAAALLFLQALGRAVNAERTQPANRTSDGALDFQTRMAIRDALDSSPSSGDGALGGLFDALIPSSETSRS